MPAMQHLFTIICWQPGIRAAMMTFASRCISILTGGVRYHVRE
jgi:hypothetical protein